METARDEGLDVVANDPYDTGPGLPTAFLPGWALEGGATATWNGCGRPRATRGFDRLRRYWLFVAMGDGTG